MKDCRKCFNLFYVVIVLFCFYFPGSLFSEVEREVEFFLVVPSFNNEKWCLQNLQSIFSQDWPHWTLCYIDDCSTDKTAVLVEEYVESCGMQSKCRIIHNSSRKGAMANFYTAIHSASSHKVIVQIDGDDWLSHPGVLRKLAEVYRDKNVWMTYGNYEPQPLKKRGSLCHPLPVEVMENNRFRKSAFVTSHLKTFYAALFQKIRKKDFMYNGRFVDAASDFAVMFPMLEMASKGHIRFIDEILYIYNTGNPISDSVAHRKKQKKIALFLRSRPSYMPLSTLSLKN
jgi:glycosyltransferase involved in cell wall biosynthesis